MNIPEAIAIDGPAASGKTTLAVWLADLTGYLNLDTGIMYRAVTLEALRKLHSVSDQQAVTRLAEEIQIEITAAKHTDEKHNVDVFLNGEDVNDFIRTLEVDANVSKVSSYPGVRLAMTTQQRRIGQRGKVVMVGRDIGTVVMPDAGLKIYLVASAEVRARRRYEEKIVRGENADYEDVLASIRKRDEIDASRDVAPMRPANDAVIIDTDTLSIDQVFTLVLNLLKKR
jgi:cytidylate kinase